VTRWQDMGNRMANQVWRTCVGCRERDLTTALVRVAKSVSETNVLVVDYAKRLPGRGAWLHRRAGCILKAVNRRAFNRALRIEGAVVDEALTWLAQPKGNKVYRKSP